jgi:hypothetical protein
MVYTKIWQNLLGKAMVQRGLLQLLLLMMIVELLLLLNQWTQKLSNWQLLKKDSTVWS